MKIVPEHVNYLLGSVSCPDGTLLSTDTHFRQVLKTVGHLPGADLDISKWKKDKDVGFLFDLFGWCVIVCFRLIRKP